MPHSVFHEIFSSRSSPDFESVVRALDCCIKKDVPKFILSMTRENFLLLRNKNDLGGRAPCRGTWPKK